MSDITLHPRLVVDDGPAALDFYVAALDAIELGRFTAPDGTMVHAEVRVGEAVFSVTEADGEHNRSPGQLGGSALLLHLTVDDADAVGEAMVAAGADVVIPIADQLYGRREGRLRDPAGHLWIVGQDVEDLTTDEIAARLAAGCG